VTDVAVLPEVDVRTITVDAGREVAWSALLDVVDAMAAPAAAGYARLVGCEPARATGPRPLAVGSTIPGFRVVRAEPGHELVLEGRHAFSRYALAFRLDGADPGPTEVSAESRAEFPGLHGRAYRLAVIGTGAHAVAVRRMLRSIRGRAESVR
jgi:hypothetical protein